MALVVPRHERPAATLLAASSIVASFLGGQALTNHPVGWLGVAALIAFGLSILACLWVLLPKNNLIFSLSGSVLYATHLEDAAGNLDTHRRLSSWLQDICSGGTGQRRSE